MKVDDDKKLEILTAMAMAMMVSRCENLVAGIKRRMDGSGYRKMHLVHLGGFKHQPKDDGDGSKVLKM